MTSTKTPGSRLHCKRLTSYARLNRVALPIQYCASR